MKNLYVGIAALAIGWEVSMIYHKTFGLFQCAVALVLLTACVSMLINALTAPEAK